MKLMILGTAAAEGVPGMFCACKACAYARKMGGKELRSRSGALVNDSLKIDFPPDAYMQALRWGLDFSMLKHILITHTHRDHFCPPDFDNARRPVNRVEDGTGPITVYGNDKGRRMLRSYLKKGDLEYRVLKPYETYDIGGMKVSPLKAVHAFDQVAMFYLIEKDGQGLLYAHDTDEFTEEHLEFLGGKKLDIVSMDCTNGVLNADYIGHMGIEDNLRMREKLLAIGAAHENTRFIANHFSHNGIVSYEEMASRLPGFTVAYDGLTVEV